MRDQWPVVLFDLDGTVANTIPLIMDSYAYATHRVLGEAVSREESRSWIGRTLVDIFGERNPGLADELIDAYLAFNAEHFGRLVEPYAGMADLLAELAAAGLRLGVVTSKRRASAERTLESVGLAATLPILTTMEDTTAHKPAPDPLWHALDLLGSRPSDCVYVGDSVFDLRCAAAAGASAVGVTWGAGTKAELDAEASHAVVDTLDALRGLLLP